MVGEVELRLAEVVKPVGVLVATRAVSGTERLINHQFAIRQRKRDSYKKYDDAIPLIPVDGK
jgi:hypothetical protein